MGRPKGTKNRSVLDQEAQEYVQNCVYSASISILGRKYEAKGDSVADCIENMKVPAGIRGRAILTIKKDDLSKDRILTPFMVARLFSQSVAMRQMAIKNVSTLFGL